MLRGDQTHHHTVSSPLYEYNVYVSTFSIIDIGPLVGKDHTTSDHTVDIKPDCLYGPQVIDVIMRKPGKITIIIDLL